MYIFTNIIFTNIVLKQKKSSMWFKENLKKSLNDRDLMIKSRLKSSMFFLVFSSFLFFLNYFLVWAGFYYDVLVNVLPYTYISLLVSFLFYFSYFFLKIFSKYNLAISYIIIIIFIVIFVLFSFLFIFWKSILDYIPF